MNSRTFVTGCARDVLTLIVPCTCTRGYTDTEDDLIEVLAELRPTHGRSLHADAPSDCLSVPASPLARR